MSSELTGVRFNSSAWTLSSIGVIRQLGLSPQSASSRNPAYFSRVRDLASVTDPQLHH